MLGEVEGGDARTWGWTGARVMLEAAFWLNPLLDGTWLSRGPCTKGCNQSCWVRLCSLFTPCHPNLLSSPEPSIREQQDLGDGETEAQRGKRMHP